MKISVGATYNGIGTVVSHRNDIFVVANWLGTMKTIKIRRRHLEEAMRLQRWLENYERERG